MFAIIIIIIMIIIIIILPVFSHIKTMIMTVSNKNDIGCNWKVK